MEPNETEDEHATEDGECNIGIDHFCERNIENKFTENPSINFVVTRVFTLTQASDFLVKLCYELILLQDFILDVCVTFSTILDRAGLSEDRTHCSDIKIIDGDVKSEK